jgi:poly(hydroxyalkanoate) depolymerase family esterase
MEVVSLIRRMARRALARAGSPARRGARAGRATAPPVARFETRSHQGRGYKLFVPSGANASRRLPLVVMLHGCRQDPDLFARDTHVNELAEVEGFLVVYPEQSAAHNGRRCWNWFDPAHQTRGGGEPAQIVAIVDAVSTEFPVDPNRIYAAGLSAGAAMSVVLGATYRTASPRSRSAPGSPIRPQTTALAASR